MLAFLMASSVSAPGDTPRVTRIDPSASEIPANMLRLYITYERPARDIARQTDVRVVDANGFPVPTPFMDFGQELWSPDGRRLTLLFDPGRLKQGVAGSGDAAPPLIQGKRYRIVVGSYQRYYLVGPPVRQPIQPSAWRIGSPVLGGRAHLSIRFDRVMDAALLLSNVGVAGISGTAVPGTPEVLEGGRVWRFSPTLPWRRGRHSVVIGDALEDVSGNRVGEALDHIAGTESTDGGTTVIHFTPSE